MPRSGSSVVAVVRTLTPSLANAPYAKRKWLHLGLLGTLVLSVQIQVAQAQDRADDGHSDHQDPSEFVAAFEHAECETRSD